MVTTALKKQEDYLRKTFNEKYKIPEPEIDKILVEVESVINQMIALVKEGKSAHEKFFSYIILNSIDAIIGFDFCGIKGQRPYSDIRNLKLPEKIFRCLFRKI